VDKVIGAAVLARRPLAGRGLLVTGRISAELAFKRAAGLAWLARRPSFTLAPQRLPPA
jgi:formate dehydrogenase assembly factor FdhD